jgi:colicin import membrane protein
MNSTIRLLQEKLNQIGLDPGLRRTYEGIEKAERDRISERNAMNRKLAEADRRVAEAKREAAEAKREADRRVAEAKREADRRIAEAKREVTEAKRETDRRVTEADRETKREIARNLKANGVPVEQIAKSTGLSEAQIREL